MTDRLLPAYAGMTLSSKRKRLIPTVCSPRAWG